MSRDDQSINLLRVHSVLSSEESALLSRLRVFSIVVTVLVLLIGTFVGTAFLAAKLRLNSVTDEKSNALKLLAFNSKKEALLLGLKSKIPLVNTAIRSQYPWDRIMETVSLVASPPILQSLTIDTTNTLTLMVSVGSLEEMNDLVGRTEELVQQKRIKNPRLGSLSTEKDGRINTSVLFTPIF